MYPVDASQTKRKKARSENVNQPNGSQDGAYSNSQALAQKRIKYDAKKVNQKICLTVDLYNCYVEGYTEIQMQDVSRRVFESREFKLNCRQLCVTAVTMNGTDCSFDMYNYLEQVVPEGEPDYSYGTFNDFYKASSNASDDGELVILVPPNLSRKRPKDTQDDPNAPRKNELFIRIHYYIKNPKGGVRFVTPDPKAYPNRFLHMYTHNEMGEGARLWVPCVDTLTERCTYDLEITSHGNMYTVASGELAEQILSDDGLWKTSIFRLDTPTTPYSLGFAVGPFDIYVHGYNFNANPLNAGTAPSSMTFEEEAIEGSPNPEKDKHSRIITSFALPGSFDELHYTSKFISQAFDFFEEYLACSFPYKSFKQVFVEEVYSTIDTAATVAFLSTHLLHNHTVIEQTYKTRYELTYALALQWFGHWIAIRYWSDIWLVYGLAGYISDLFCRKMFGHNYYRYKLFKDCESICNNEVYYNTPLMLLSGTHAPTMVQLSDILSNKVFKRKSRFVIYMIEKRIGSDALRKVLSSIVSGNIDSGSSNNNNPTPTPTASSLNPISENVDRNFYTKKFLKLIRRMSGHDLRSFADRWIYGVGTPSLTCGFFFNRKKHVIELALKQNRSLCGRMSGSLSIRVNELEGPYDHSVNFDDDLHAFEFPCHSRVRKVRKKRKLKKGDKDKEEDPLVNIVNGKEDEDDPNDPKKTETPVLWIRVDPELEFLRQVSFPQGEVMLINMLEGENDVVGQCEAIEGLINHISSYKAVEALNRVLCNPQMYYKIRIRAAKAMAKSPTIGLDLLLKFFRGEYYDNSGNQIRANNFDNINSYLVQKGLVKAIASVKDKDGRTSSEAAEFLFDLLKNNDNSRNQYSDNAYIVTILQSLTQMEVPSMTGKVIKQIERHLSIEKLVPSYHNVITVACLKCLSELMKQNKANINIELFKDYTVYGHFEKVRTSASKYLLDLAVAFSGSQKGRDVFDFLMDIVDRDKVSYIKRKILQYIIQLPNPVYHSNTTYYNSYMPSSIVQRMDSYKKFFREITEAPTTPERLWTLMNSSGTSFDGMVRSMAARLFFKLYLMDVPRAWEHKPRSHKIIVKRQPGPAPFSKRVPTQPGSSSHKRKAPDITVTDLSPVSTPVTPSSAISEMAVEWENAMSPPPQTTVVELPPPLPVSPREIKMEDVAPQPTPPPPLPTPPPLTTTTLTPVGSTKIVLKMKSLEQIREFNLPMSPPPLTPTPLSPPPITSLPPPLTNIVPLPETIPPQPAPQPAVQVQVAPTEKKEKKHRDKEHKKHRDKKERKEKKEKKERKKERRLAKEAEKAASLSNSPAPTPAPASPISIPSPVAEPPKVELLQPKVEPQQKSLHIAEIPLLSDIKPPVVELPPALPVPADLNFPPQIVPASTPAPASPVATSPTASHDKYKTVSTGVGKIKITLGKKSQSVESGLNLPSPTTTSVHTPVPPPPLPVSSEIVDTPPSTPSTPSQTKEGSDNKKVKKVRIRIQDQSVAERDISH